jgi:aminoglycoside phosphotransferase (APT) family kinase protein
VTAVGHGGTTPVFHVRRGGAACYVRLAERPGQEMLAEAWAHERLRALGGRVAAVIAVEPAAGPLGRGALALTPMPGSPLTSSTRPQQIRGAAREAGRELALLNSLPVTGFGFVADRPPLTGPSADAGSDLVEPALRALGGPAGALLGRDSARVRILIGELAEVVAGQPPRLAHGDFDGGHIYADAGGYRGILDLGEMRGAPPLYDIAHFALHEPQLAAPAVSQLRSGYAERSPLPERHAQLLRALTLLIGVRLLDTIAGRGADAYERLLVDGLRAGSIGGA